MDFHLLGSLRFDRNIREADWNSAVNGNQPSSYLLLPYIVDRFVDAATIHGWTIPAELSLPHLRNLCDKAVYPIDGPQKIRIIISKLGDIKITTGPVPHIPHSLISAATINPISENVQTVVSIYLDNKPTQSGDFTRTKTTNRPHYDAARARANIPPVGTPTTSDVLLYNSDNLLTETSIRNFALFRSDRWVTPALDSGCLPGIMRRLLVEQGLVVEGLISKHEVNPGEIVLLFNGVEGCTLGRMVS